MRKLIICLCFALASNSALPQDTLSPTERQIIQWIGAHEQQMHALIEQTVNINSGTMNHEGVREVGRVMAKEFERIGFTTRWIDMPAEANRAGHLFARKEGDRGPRILAIGHLDTVFEANDAFQRYEQEGGYARGPGIADMKSGNVIMLYALKALASVGALEGAQIVAAFTGDEENHAEPLSVSRGDLLRAGEWADISLGFEGGIRDEQAEWATVSRRSSSDWLLKVSGKQSHSSGIFSDNVGAGAIFEAARILQGFYDSVRGEQYLTFNAGVILGGTEVDYDYANNRGSAFGKTNVVPSTLTVHGGMRAISLEQLERAREAMRAVVADSLPHTSATIEFGDGYPPMAPTPGNIALQKMLSQINVDLGGAPMPALDPSRRGAADISFVAPLSDSIAGLGAYGTGEHSPREKLELASVPLATQRAALLIYRLLQQAGETP